MLSIEPVLARAGGRAAAYVGRKALDIAQRKRLAAQVRPLIAKATLASFVDRLTPSQAGRFEAFIASAQFDHLALQVMSWQLAGRSEAALAEVRQSVRLSLKTRVELAGENLLTGTDLVVQLLTVAVEVAMPSVAPSTAGVVPTSVMLAVAADIAAAAARNNELLERVTSVAAIDRYAASLRSQVQRMRSRMRLTHLGNRSAVEYAHLHIDPRFTRPGQDDDEYPTWTIGEIIEERQRVVVLGDPGAGKSTFAAKLAHDVAADRLAGPEGRVPFLLIARELTETVRAERRPLRALLEQVAADPYNVTAPPDAVEYLLLNGLAVVIIDGLDEFGDPATRQRLVELVEGFAHLYPTVNVVVTSREVGYSDAPLDPALFSSWRIAPFDDGQIGRYTRNWFDLDEHLPAAEIDELVESFLSESADIPDLCSNPLMLSLLCSLYSSKHYIPRYRSEIYEHCAEMLFERWDHSRGIAVPMRFASHMRSAIARLAWMMFNDHEQGLVVSRERITGFLVDYMMEERFDTRADAAAAVEEFLDYCAGRAWVLTKIGTHGHRTVYGFTHRTFLEYFAAVQLVRMGPSADEVWNRLAPHLPDGSWRVVAHLSVHILDRDAEGGGSRFVDRLVTEAVASPDRAALLAFGAEVAGQLSLRTPTLRALALEAVRLAGERPVKDRWRYYSEPMAVVALEDADRPLTRLLDDELPENASRLATAIVQAFIDPQFDLTAESSSYGLLVAMLTKWTSGPGSLEDAVREGLAIEEAAQAVQRWVDLVKDPSAAEVRQRGASCLFKAVEFGGRRTSSVAVTTLRAVLAQGPAMRSDDAARHLDLLERLYEPVVQDPWPWLKARSSAVTLMVRHDGRYLLKAIDADRFLTLNPTQRSTALLLLLPLIQEAAIDLKEPPDRAKLFAALLAARKSGWQRKAAIKQVEEWALRKRAHDRVVSWVSDKASTVLRSG